MSRKFSEVAGTKVSVYVDWVPGYGKQMLLYWKGKFIMPIRADDGLHRKLVYEHFQKLRSKWHRTEGRKAELEPLDRESEYQERRANEDWEEFVDDAADWAVYRPISVNVSSR